MLSDKNEALQKVPPEVLEVRPDRTRLTPAAAVQRGLWTPTTSVHTWSHFIPKHAFRLCNAFKCTTRLHGLGGVNEASVVSLLQEYVLEQIRQFAVEFAQQLVPQITQQHLDLAFSRALYALSARSSQQTLKLQLRFMHKCK